MSFYYAYEFNIYWSFVECCHSVSLESTTTSEKEFKVLGEYILQDLYIVENHPVYKHETGDQHLAFSGDYGWTVLLIELHNIQYS